MDGKGEPQPARQGAMIQGTGHRRTPWRPRRYRGQDRLGRGGNGGLGRSRIDRRFPPLGVKTVPAGGPAPFRRGGVGLTCRRSCYAQCLSLRGRSPRRCGSGFSRNARTGLGTTRICRVPCEKAKRGCASRVPLREGLSERPLALMMSVKNT